MEYKIGIDVDGVLRDDSGIIMGLFKYLHPNSVKSKVIDGWDFPNVDLPLQRKMDIMFKEYPREIFEESEVIEGAKEGFLKLKDWADKQGHKLACVTHQQPNLIHHTLIWLGKNKFNFEEILVTGEKEKTDVDFLVDDSPVNYQVWVKAGRDPKRFILVDQTYNQYVDAPNRVKNIGASLEVIQREILENG